MKYDTCEDYYRYIMTMQYSKNYSIIAIRNIYINLMIYLIWKIKNN